MVALQVVLARRRRSDSVPPASRWREALTPRPRGSTRTTCAAARPGGQRRVGPAGGAASRSCCPRSPCRLDADQVLDRSSSTSAPDSRRTSSVIAGTRRRATSSFAGRKFADLSRTTAELEQAQATGAAAALPDGAPDRGRLLRRARQPGARPRGRASGSRRGGGAAGGRAGARRCPGAAVQTDSLQLVLELTPAPRRPAAGATPRSRVARLQLGRRVGEAGPVDAPPTPTPCRRPTCPSPCRTPCTDALAQGPQYRVARAERARGRALGSAAGGARTCPRVVARRAATPDFDVKFFPTAPQRVVGHALRDPPDLERWASGRSRVTQARVNRDVSRAIRDDLERGALARRDRRRTRPTGPRGGRSTSPRRRSWSRRENYRVQEPRYRAGATTILDLLDAQLSLTQAEADVVQARYATRLALAGLEVDPGPPTLPEQGRPVRALGLTNAARPLAASRRAPRRRPSPRRAGSGGPGAGGPPAMPVEVAVARTDTVVDAILATGQIEAMQSIELRPGGRGTARRRSSSARAAEVVKGTPLFKVDDAELKAAGGARRGRSRSCAPGARAHPRAHRPEGVVAGRPRARRGHRAEHPGPARAAPAPAGADHGAGAVRRRGRPAVREPGRLRHDVHPAGLAPDREPAARVVPGAGALRRAASRRASG